QHDERQENGEKNALFHLRCRLWARLRAGRRHRIPARRREGVAPQEPPQRQQCTAADAVRRNRLGRIPRARRLEAARTADERTEQKLVGVNERERETTGRTHRRLARSSRPRAPTKSAVTASKGAVTSSRRGMTTMSS